MAERRDHGDTRDSAQILLTPVMKVLRNLNRRSMDFLGRTWELMFPYSTRSIRRRKWRAGVLALCVALTILVFVMFDSFFAATTLGFRGRVDDIAMLNDLVAYGDEIWAAGDIHRLNFMPEVGAFDVGCMVEVYTPLGKRSILALDEGSFDPQPIEGVSKPSAGTATLLDVKEGALPEHGGEVILPADLARGAGVGVGDEFTVRWQDPNGQLQPHTYVVSGLYAADDPVLTEPITRLQEVGLFPFAWAKAQQGEHARVPGNLLLVNSDSPERLARRLQDRLTRVRTVTAQHGQELAGGLLSGVFSTGQVLVLLVLVFSALGVLNALLLTFLERQRELGIFKAMGTLNDEVRIMLLQEGFLTAACGIIAGLVLSWTAVTLLNKYTLTTYLLTARSMLVAVLAALIAFYLGATVPATMATRRTVQDLLQRKNVI